MFSRRVSFPPREPWHQDFMYSGRNAYAYLIARYGSSTYDFVSMQLCTCPPPTYHIPSRIHTTTTTTATTTRVHNADLAGASVC